MVLQDLFSAGNDEVVWTIGIAMYIFLSGLSGGAFIVGASSDALGKERYRPLAKLGVVSALLLLALAPVFLIIDLSQPLRAYYTLLYPNPSSVMSFGVFLLTAYGLVAGLYAYLLFRRDLVRIVSRLQNQAVRGLLLSLLRLTHQLDISPTAMARDACRASHLAKAGMGLALALASYTGFILAVVAARDMWHSALIPVLFLFSAMVSGTALVLVLKYVQDRFCSPSGQVDQDLLKELGTRLRHLFVEDVVFLLFWLITLDHSSRGSRDSLWLLLQGPFQISFLGLQVLLGSLVPLAILYHPHLRDKISHLVLASLLILVGITVMRYNVVIGGQALPMSRGELVGYSLSGFEMVLVTLIFTLLGLLFLLTVKILPLDYPFIGSDDPYPRPQVVPRHGSQGGHDERTPAARVQTATIVTDSPALSVGGSSPLGTAGDQGPDAGRRAFLKTSGSTLAMVALGGWGPRTLADLVSEADTGVTGPRRRYAMVIDMRKCIGCHSCTQACKQEYDLPPNVWRSWVKKLSRTRDGQVHDFFLPRLCNQCDDPPCVPVCPVKATFQDENGLVRQRYDRCIGCKYCIVSCPYSARFINPRTQVVEKCDFCHDRLIEGRQPACVEACPAGARIFGDLYDPEAQVTKLVNSQPTQTLKPELGTRPQVYYIAADQQIMMGGLF